MKTEQHYPKNKVIFDSSEDDNRLIRVTLTKVFSWLAAIILVLFLSVTLLSFTRLLKFQEILSDINEKSIPSVVTSSQIYTQVNTLTFLTEGLAKSSNEASKRIAFQNIEDKVNEIRALSQQGEGTSHMEVQIDAIIAEFSELDSLVAQRLSIRKQLDEKVEELYTLHASSIEELSAEVSIEYQHAQFDWMISFSEIVTLSSQLPSLHRLHLIRQLSEKLKEKLAGLNDKAGKLPKELQDKRKSVYDQLDFLLLSDTGLVELSLSQLRVTGRTSGRGNFVKNLINDFARMAEYRSGQINLGVLSNTQESARSVTKQTSIIGTITVFSAAILISIGIFVQRRVVSRLAKLNKLVQQRLAGNYAELRIDGEDEISDIAETFEHFATTIEEQKQALHQLSLSDGLTGIANRRAFDERLGHEMITAERQGWSISVLMMDVDFFKQFNDHYGHAAGDVCLQDIGQALNNHLSRKGDFVARYGGEEFVCILPDTTTKGAQKVAQGIVECIEALKIPHQYSGAAESVTVSVGVATCEPQSPVTSKSLVENADQALYMAKRTGRNRWHYFKAVPIGESLSATS